MIKTLCSGRDATAALAAIGAASVLINILNLTGSLFMLEVYDRIIPSKSISSLLGLSIICLVLYAFQAGFEIIRARLFVRNAEIYFNRTRERTFRSVLKLPLIAEIKGDGRQALNDLDQVKSFLSGTALTALFDFPWIPLYLLIAFAFHYLLGLAIVGGAVILIAITLLTNILARSSVARSTSLAGQRAAFVTAAQRCAESIKAMGMTGIVTNKWLEYTDEHNYQNRRTSDVIGSLGTASRTFRYVLQSAVLGIGAILVVRGETSAGSIIASSILTARALAPIDVATSNWRSFIAARQSMRRLENFLAGSEREQNVLSLPEPSKSLTLEGVTGGPPGQFTPTVIDISFSLRPGNALCIIGPSASGKSSLARLLLGIWESTRGSVKLDGAPLQQWHPDHIGSYIGYLPQDVELMPGSVAQNIARLNPQATPGDVIAAAEAAGIHRLILNLPNGYNTEIGTGGLSLSAGQRQRIGLARALFKNPFLVVLDEPNSNLDAEGERALSEAIAAVRQRGGIAIIIAHRPSVLQNADLVLVMNNGRLQLFGEKERVMSALLGADTRAATLRPATKVIEGSEERLVIEKELSRD